MTTLTYRISLRKKQEIYSECSVFSRNLIHICREMDWQPLANYFEAIHDRYVQGISPSVNLRDLLDISGLQPRTAALLVQSGLESVESIACVQDIEQLENALKPTSHNPVLYRQKTDLESLHALRNAAREIIQYRDSSTSITSSELESEISKRDEIIGELQKRINILQQEINSWKRKRNTKDKTTTKTNKKRKSDKQESSNIASNGPIEFPFQYVDAHCNETFEKTISQLVGRKLYFYLTHSRDNCTMRVTIHECYALLDDKTVCRLDLMPHDNDLYKSRLLRLHTLFADTSTVKVSHDLLTAMSIICATGTTLLGELFDIMLAESLLLNGTQSVDAKEHLLDLTELITKYSCKMTLDIKNHSTCNDHVRHLFSVFSLPELEKTLRVALHNERLNLAMDLDMSCLCALSMAKCFGARFHDTQCKTILNLISQKRDKLLRQMSTETGTTWTVQLVQSPMRFGKILIERLGIKELARHTTSTGRYSMKAELLEEHQDKHNIISLLLQCRKLVTMYNLVKSMRDKAKFDPGSGTHRLYYNFNLCRTGRIVAEDHNMQAIPKADADIVPRSLIVADDPHAEVVMSFDYRQIEYRLIAHFTKDRRLLDIFADHRRDLFTEISNDLHCTRDVAKTLVYATAYGGNAENLFSRLKLDLDTVSLWMRKLKSQFRQVYTFRDRYNAEHRVSRSRDQKCVVTTISGRRRLMSEKDTSPWNSFIQGSAADIFKKAIYLIDHELQCNPSLQSDNSATVARLLFPVHDELVFVVNNKYCEQFCKVVTRIMQEDVKRELALCVELMVKVCVGHSWGLLAEIEQTPQST